MGHKKIDCRVRPNKRNEQFGTSKPNGNGNKDANLINLLHTQFSVHKVDEKGMKVVFYNQKVSQIFVKLNKE